MTKEFLGALSAYFAKCFEFYLHYLFISSKTPLSLVVCSNCFVRSEVVTTPESAYDNKNNRIGAAGSKFTKNEIVITCSSPQHFTLLPQIASAGFTCPRHEWPRNSGKLSHVPRHLQRQMQEPPYQKSNMAGTTGAVQDAVRQSKP